ncbi:MAG TPA: FecR family protein [Pyrinomonadaceae bacterium]|nr:FecR family protein [Pyrinomonadaceae bacterium]
MRRVATGLVLSISFLLLSSFSAQAQNREKFVISARAGGINAVTGRAVIHPRGSSESELLTIKEDLEAGDIVTTGIDGRVEMLLNPGSYLRLGGNSEFELANNSIENLEVRLVRGTAIVEATGADDTELSINITTPHAKLAIVRRGLYRLNVIPGDATELIVRKGRVMLGDSHTKVKGGNKVIFSNNSYLVAKLDKADKKRFDDMDAWSKQRAETLAEANRRMRGRDLNLLMASLYDSWPHRFPSRSWGFWLFDTRSSCFTFLPFYLGWGSPYGSSYSNAFFGDYYCCGRRYGLPGVSSRGSGGGGIASGSGDGGTSVSRPGRVERQPTTMRPAPAMTRMPDASSGGRSGRINRVQDRQH